MREQLPLHVSRALTGLKPSGDQWIAHCPLHEDSTASLTVKSVDGKVLAHCHAGCDQNALAETLQLHEAAPIVGEWTPNGPAIAQYDYANEASELLYQVLRSANKQFSQRRRDHTTKSGWRYSLGDTRRVLYRLPELIAAVHDGQIIYIPEGEKDVNTLSAFGKVATCNSGGAGKWRPEFADYFRDAHVVIIADKDAPGQAHARMVATNLQPVAASVTIVEAADPHKDVSAHLDAGLDFDALVITHTPDEVHDADLAPDIHDLLESEEPDYSWLIPGLLERGDRLMLTGGEGLGKSMLMRMFAVTMAAGIHPFTFAPIAPLKVLMIDCENSRRQTRRKFRDMVHQAEKQHRPVPRGQLRIILRPNGLDLVRDDDASWLLERVIAHKPDVLIIGPLYRLHLDNPNDEETARRVVAALDTARNAADCALLVEAHAGHGEWGKNRSVRPVGSSLYLRWPEFGYGIKAYYNEDKLDENYVELVSWRGARDERSWPTVLRKAIGFPWQDASDPLLRNVS